MAMVVVPLNMMEEHYMLYPGRRVVPQCGNGCCSIEYDGRALHGLFWKKSSIVVSIERNVEVTANQ